LSYQRKMLLSRICLVNAVNVAEIFTVVGSMVEPQYSYSGHLSV